jgi:AbrB family looped-hinge helix DNA binding protein
MAMLINQLKLQRSRKGFTQEQVAEQVGVSRQAVAKWEKGETLPDIETCVRLADLYGIPLDALVRGMTEEKKTGAGQHMFGVAKVNEKGQITLPVQIRERFGIAPGNMILVLADTEKGIALVNIAAAEEGGTFTEAPAMYGEE